MPIARKIVVLFSVISLLFPLLNSPATAQSAPLPAPGDPEAVIAEWSQGRLIDVVAPVPQVHVLEQPNGLLIEARLTGYEIGGHFETLEGDYAIAQGEDGWWRYAVRPAQPLSQADRLAGSRSALRPLPARVGVDARPEAAQPQGGRLPSLWIDPDTGQGDVREALWDAIRAQNAGWMENASPSAPVIRRYVAIMVAYSDTPFENTQSYFQSLFSGEDESAPPTGSLTQYYLENSYDQFKPIVDVYGPFTAPGSRCQYGNPDTAIRNAVAAIMPLADPLIDFSQYDNDSNNEVDMLIVVHAGRGEEASGDPCDVWSHRFTFSPSIVTQDGVYLGNYNTGPDVGANMGVYAHEMAHSLGEADWYDTSYNTAGTGEWDMMAGGSWLGNPGGSNPAHFSPITKVNQGWIAPTTISDTTLDLTIRPKETHPDLFEIILPGNQRFYLEVFSNSTPGALFDRHIHGPGLLIWHRDPSGSQSNSNRMGMAVEEYDFRDGTQEIRSSGGVGRGERSDAWTGDSAGMGPGTSPSTDPNFFARQFGWTFTNLRCNADASITLDVIRNTGATRDLAPDYAEVTGADLVYEGDAVNLAATIYNHGGASASNVGVRFYAGDPDGGGTLIGETTVTVSGYGSATATTPWVAAAHTDVIVVVDAAGAIAESNEGNNRSLAEGRLSQAQGRHIVVWPREASVLIVDDDGNEYTEEAYAAVLNALGVPYVITPEHAYSSLLGAHEATFWIGGQGRRNGQLDLLDRISLRSHLNAGGKVWFSSPRLASALDSDSSAALGVDPAFLHNYLGVAHEETSQTSGGYAQALGDEIGGIGRFNQRPFPGRPLQDFVSLAGDPYGVATLIFEGPNEFDEIGHRGSRVAGDVAHNNFQTVYTGFNLAQTLDIADQAQLVSDVLDWFGVSAVALAQRTIRLGADAAVRVRLRDQDLNTDPYELESVTIQAVSDSEPGGEMITLWETGSNSGVFGGWLAVGAENAAGRLLVAEGDRVRVTYDDADPAAVRWDEAVVASADAAAPTVHMWPVRHHFEGSDLTLGGVIQDDVAVQAASLFYRLHGSGPAYVEQPLDLVVDGSKGVAGAFQLVLPGSLVTQAGLDYYVEARDAAGNVTRHPSRTDCGDDFHFLAAPPHDSQSNPPQALFGATPAHPQPGQIVTFPDLSTDSDGAIVTWAWDYGDGAHSVLADGSHVFAGTGVYPVQLSVTDDAGAVDTHVLELVVGANVCPADVNSSGAVDTLDIIAVAESWGAQAGDPGFDMLHDLDDDGKITIVDVLLVSSHWQESCP